MRYLRTTKGIVHAAPERRSPLAAAMEEAAFRVARAAAIEANPDYVDEGVRAWLIEFDDDDCPDREVAVDDTGAALFAGPDDENYGFWLDTDLRFSDFNGEPISAEEFEAAWARGRAAMGR